MHAKSLYKTAIFLSLWSSVVGLTLVDATEEISQLPYPPKRPPPSISQIKVSTPNVSASLKLEAEAAIQRGLDWLVDHQQEDGHWSNAGFPALTALPLWALVKGDITDRAPLQKAVSFILSCVHDDGAIYAAPKEKRKGGGLSNYNTAICMVALHAFGDPKLIPVVQKARKFLARTQHFGNDIYRGGMGYDPDTGRPYADLSNSYITYEAMRLTENVEHLRAEAGDKVDLDWNAATKFIERIQNRPESNDQPWASDDPELRGGFAYKPDSSMAGSVTNKQGVVSLRSYGSMTYAGLLSFIYAKVDKNDGRVQSAYDWTLKHWTLEENPGMGGQGLYYYYHVLAKALAVFGRETLVLENGKEIVWREELIKTLVGHQKVDPKTGFGYWVNEAGRWWESDPVLVTSYALLSLEIALGH